MDLVLFPAVGERMPSQGGTAYRSEAVGAANLVEKTPDLPFLMPTALAFPVSRQ